jgi:hypothetical protein
MPQNQPTNKKSANKWLALTSVGMQMGITILVFALLGQWLDGYLHSDKPYFAAAFALFGVFGSMYLLIKNLPKD